MRLPYAIVSGLCLLMLPLSLRAAPYDGSVPLLCAAMTALECADTGECQRGTAASMDLPSFVVIDFAKKLVRTTEQDGRSSPFKNVEHLNGHMVLQGAENGRGWTIVIAEATGTLSATVVGDQVSFVIFGACTPR